jgi:hypothetical protein
MDCGGDKARLTTSGHGALGVKSGEVAQQSHFLNAANNFFPTLAMDRGGEASVARRRPVYEDCTSVQSNQQEYLMTEQVSPLRQRMIDDMTIRNMAPNTQKAYIRAVANVSKHFGKTPDKAANVLRNR